MSLQIRSAQVDDLDTIVDFITQLAKYEQLSHQVVGRPENLRRHLFGDRPCVQAVLAEWEGNAAGIALFFYNYSTFLMQPGIYLEDLFVLPVYRRYGIGTALLQHLAQRAIQEGCGRLEWSVLDWNAPAIAFYECMGASILPDWRICRVTGPALDTLAAPPEPLRLEDCDVNKPSP